MDIPPTQVFEDNDFTPTQRLTHSLQYDAEDEIQVGVLTIGENTYTIKKGVNQIGRHPDCNIILDDPTVSKKHAEIEANNSETSAWICDLNSSNKTKLNNSILRPRRCYELKDGSSVDFGMVHAIYTVHRPIHNPFIPETPVSTYRQEQSTVIPGTPDSSLENISMIPGTQAGDEEAVFRRPSLPQRTSTSSRKSFIQDSSVEDSSMDDSRCFGDRGKENVGGPRVSIHDMEMQKSFESQGDTEVDIHDVETQKICLVSRALGKAPPNRQIDIQDMETQHEEDVETHCIPTNIHDIDTQHEEDVEMHCIPTNIHDIDTQHEEDVAMQCIPTNIHDIDTQHIPTDIHDIDTQQDEEIHDILTPKKSSAKNVSTGKDESIRDVENRQLGERKVTADERNDANNLEQNAPEKAAIAKDDGATTNTEQVGNVQRGSQESQLSLNTNFEDESELDMSRNLLGSQNLFDFIENDDSLDEVKSKSATSANKTTEKSSDEENIFDAATQVGVVDENIFEAVTQRIALPFKAALMDEDSDDTDQEGVFQTYSRKDSQDSAGPAKSQLPASEDSDTDEEGRFTEIALKEKRASCSFEVGQNASKEAKNDAGSSKDSDNIFDTLTQHVNQKNKDPTEVEGSKADVDYDVPTQMIGTNKPEAYASPESDTEGYIDDLAPTQIIPSEFHAEANEANSVVSTKSKVAVSEEGEDITEMEDNTATQILSFTEKVSDADDKESLKSFDVIPTAAEESSTGDIDYEMAPTQLLSEIEKMPPPNSSEKGKNPPKKSHKVNLDDTVERNLNEMFDDVNEQDLDDQSMISTQVLTNMLQSSQCEDASKDTPNVDSSSPEISKVKRFARGRRSKASTDSILESSPGRKSRRSNLNTTANVESENTEQYSSALTSPRKRNILIDSQDSSTPIEIVSDKKKAEKVATRSETVDATNKRNRVADACHPSPKGSTTPRSSRRHAEESKSELILDEKDLSKNVKRVLDESLPGEKSDALIGIIPHRQISILLEDDDEDILAGFPEVRISGTLSNPASPTTSSWTRFAMRSGRNPSKQDSKKVAPKKRVKQPRKSFAQINTENTEPSRNISKSNSSEILASCGNFDVEKSSTPMHESDDEKVNGASKEPAKNTSRRLRKSKGSESLTHEKSVPFANTQEQATHIPSIQSNGRTRNSTKENVDRSSVFQVGKEAPVANAELAKITVSNASRVGKRSHMDLIESSNTKKRKEDVNEDAPAATKGGRSNGRSSIVTRRSPANILDYVVKKSSPLDVETWDTPNLPHSHSTLLSKQLVVKVARISPSLSAESIADGIVSKESNRSRRSSVNSQSSLSSLTTTESVEIGQGMERTRKTSQRVGNRRKPEVEDISSQIGEESQEVEMIMNASLKVQAIRLEMEKNIGVSEGAKTTRLRNTRKRAGANARSDVDLAESSASSDLSEADNVHFEVPAAKAKRPKISRPKTPHIADTTADSPTTRATRNSKNPSRSTRGHHKSIADSLVEESAEVSVNETSANGTAGQVKVPKKRGRKPKVKKQEEDFIEDNNSSEMNSSLDTASVLSSPSRTRRGMSSSFTTASPFKVRHRILFTGLETDFSKLLTKLGASQVQDPTKCTVLVTDKVRRTFKFLCALAQSVPIVSVDWLSDSEKAGQFVELENYILKDPAAEVKFGFKLRGSLEKAREHKLLLGYTVVLTSNVEPPPISEWKSIISSCGGKPLVRPPASWPEKAVIISKQEDLTSAKKFLAKAPKTVTVQSTEFILTGILRQELNFVKYKLT